MFVVQVAADTKVNRIPRGGLKKKVMEVKADWFAGLSQVRSGKAMNRRGIAGAG